MTLADIKEGDLLSHSYGVLKGIVTGRGPSILTGHVAFAIEGDHEKWAIDNVCFDRLINVDRDGERIHHASMPRGYR